MEKMLLEYLPEEKVEKADSQSTSVDEFGSVEREHQDLKKAGIDVDSGLTYCMNDMEFYESILAEFARDYTDKAEKLNTYKKDKNWKNYSILIHSVKSSARTIGAKELAARALDLEKASADGNEAVIMQNHDSVMVLYEGTCHHQEYP